MFSSSLTPCSTLPATTVPNVKIGIQTRSLRQPLRQALRTAARLGADGVEIDARTELRPGELSRTGLREFHKLLDDLNLRVSAVAFPTRRGYDVPDDLERRVLATQAAMRFAATLRTDVVDQSRRSRAGRLGVGQFRAARRSADGAWACTASASAHGLRCKRPT